MNAEKDIYASCDKAIQAMNRWNLEEFGKLKMSRFDQVNIIKTVVSLYRRSTNLAKRKYRKVARDAYLYGLYLCEIVGERAEKMADRAITEKWLEKILTETDFVTLYRFDTEAERKAYRLAETLEATQDLDYEVNKALRAWSQQLGQYAINFTDYAEIQAFKDAGIEFIEWVAVGDRKTCNECYALNGQQFRIDEIPPKHPNCRCHYRAIFQSRKATLKD